MTVRAPNSIAGDARPRTVFLAVILALVALGISASVGAVPLPQAAIPVPASQSPRPPDAPTQQTGQPLTLEQALRLAEATSEQLAIARAGVDRAGGEALRARAELFPQVSGSASYDRTLASEFEGIFGSTAAEPCAPYSLQPNAPLEDRVAEIERAIDCGAIGGNLFGGGGEGEEVDLPFGHKNIYRFGLIFSQTLYAGGRVRAQRDLATVGRRLSEVALSSTHAQVALDATQAYYDAALSDRLLAIAEAALQQASDTLAQVQLSHQAGRLPEFELLRARVARDNQRPVVLRARSQRTLAYLRLRDVLHLPDGAPLQVAANLDDPVLPPPSPFAAALADREAASSRTVSPDERTAVRQAAAGVEAREAGLRIARSQRLPSVTANSSYGRVAYAGLPGYSDFRTNWTIGVAAQIPILTGGRLKGDEIVARADLAEARAQLSLTRHLADLDSRAAFEELQAARATWEASAGTVEQATRAYQIAELRYREGISTQLELSDARLLLEQSQANRAQAARDLQVARARIALLPDLPFAVTGAGGSATGGASSQGANWGSGSRGSTGTGASSRGATGQGGAAQGAPGGIRQ